VNLKKLNFEGGDFFMASDKVSGAPDSLVMQQIGMLNLRINDMMTQLNAVMKALMDENAALKQENSELKSKQQQ
jgi:hypothetical protein